MMKTHPPRRGDLKIIMACGGESSSKGIGGGRLHIRVGGSQMAIIGTKLANISRVATKPIMRRK